MCVAKTILAAAAAGAAAGVVYYFVSGKVARPPGPPKVFLFGDSHSVGLDVAMKKLAAADGVEYASDPKGGTGAPYWAYGSPSYIEKDLAAFKPTIAIFSLGGNDTYMPTPERVPLIKDGVRHIVGAIRASGAVPVWLESPKLPWPDTIGDRELWLDSGAVHFSGEKFDGEERDSLGVHLSLPGYARWATDIWGRLKKIGLID